MKQHLQLIIFLLLPLSLLSQKAIKGNLHDATSKEAVSYANIFYKNHQHIGTMSQPDGSFVLRRIETAMTDTLVISMLGYKTQYYPVSMLMDNPLDIAMELEAIRLNEISIVSDDALRELLRKVVEHIPQNYPSEKHKLIGYYQEYSASFDEYKHYLDAYISVENQNYKDDHPLTFHPKLGTKSPQPYHKIYAHQLRRSDDLRLLPPHIEKVSDSPVQSFLRANKIYSKSFHFLSLNHSLEDLLFDVNSMNTVSSPNKQFLAPTIIGLGEQYQGKDTLVRIGLMEVQMRDSITGETYFLVQNELLINKSNYAVERMISMGSQEFNDKVKSTSGRPFEYFLEVRYRNINGTYYPSMISSDFGFMYMMETQHDFVSRRFIVLETEATKKQYHKRKPRKKVPNLTSLKDLKLKYDPEFWESFQIPPKLEASVVVKAALSRTSSLEEQFKKNQRKIK